jgi:hypothetical protein
MKEHKKIEFIGHYGAALSLIEVGLGSILHSLKIPFSGILLSLNQGYLLCRAALKGEEFKKSEWMTYRVSNIAAVLKSLSPAGKKIGPMFSLSVQGLLFNLGVFLFGVNVFGLCFGMILLSTWTFIQPLVTYYLFFGDKIFTAVEYLYTKTLPYHHVQKKHLWLFFIFLVCLKMVIACFLAIVALRRKNKSYSICKVK